MPETPIGENEVVDTPEKDITEIGKPIDEGAEKVRVLVGYLNKHKDFVDEGIVADLEKLAAEAEKVLTTVREELKTLIRKANENRAGKAIAEQLEEILKKY